MATKTKSKRTRGSGRPDPRQIGQHCGTFDPVDPWPDGSEICLNDGAVGTLVEADLEYEMITVRWSDCPEPTSYDISEWNSQWADSVEEVNFPQGGRGAGAVKETAALIKHERPEAGETASSMKEQPGSVKTTPRADLVMVPIDQIDDRHNIRSGMDEGFLLQLTDSIRDLGMLEPLIIRKLSKADAGNGTVGSHAKKFRVVAGHQRLEAARRAGEEFVEAKVYSGSNVDDAWEAKARLAENVQRQDLNHMELARAFGDAVAVGLSVRQVAEQAHVSDDMVRRHLALLRLTKPVADLVASGRLPVHQAELIARVGDVGKQISLAERCLALGWNAKKGAWTDKPNWNWREGDPKDYVMTMAELRKEVAYAMCGLAACGWLKAEAEEADGKYVGADARSPETPISDAGGIAGKRACEGCPDNTMTYADHPTLFAGIRPQGSDKKGYCTNRPCYEAKTKVWEKVKDKRAKEKEKKQKAVIAKAKKAGLDVCEACGKVADAGDKFDKCGQAANARLCPKCAEKAVSRTSRRGNESYAEQEKQRKKLQAQFPRDDAERHALALWQWGQEAAELIADWIETVDCQAHAHEAAAAICSVLGIRLANQDGYNSEITLDVELKEPPTFSVVGEQEKTTAEALAAIWRDAAMIAKPQWGQPLWHEYKPGIGHDLKADCVPLPPAAVAMIDLYEQLINHLMLDTKTARPQPGASAKSNPGDAARERFIRIMGGGPDEGTILRVEADMPDGEGVEARLPNGTLHVIEAGTPTAPAMQSEIARWRNERESHVLNLIRQGRKKEAMAMIEIELEDEGDWLTPAELLAMLKSAQSTGLKGDWRRAAVAKRIKQLAGDIDVGSESLGDDEGED